MIGADGCYHAKHRRRASALDYRRTAPLRRNIGGGQLGAGGAGYVVDRLHDYGGGGRARGRTRRFDLARTFFQHVHEKFLDAAFVGLLLRQLPEHVHVVSRDGAFVNAALAERFPIGMRGPAGPSRRRLSSKKVGEAAFCVARFSRGGAPFFPLRPGARALCFFLFEERPPTLFGAIFCLGMAIFFRVDKSHDGAVERLAMVGAVAVAAKRAECAALPEDGRRAGRHECDAGGHHDRAWAEG